MQLFFSTVLVFEICSYLFGCGFSIVYRNSCPWRQVIIIIIIILLIISISCTGANNSYVETIKYLLNKKDYSEAQLLRLCAASQKVADLIPDGVFEIFQ